MTSISAEFLAPDVLRRRGLTPSSIQHLASGRRPADAAELARMRVDHAGEWAFVHTFDEAEPDVQDLIRKAMVFGDSAVASDAIEPIWRPSAP